MPEDIDKVALFIRMVRYAIVIFLIMGVYPFVFPLFEQVERNNHCQWSEEGTVHH